MGFRPALDLREILRDYEVFGGTPRLRRTESEHFGVVADGPFSVLAGSTVTPDPPDEPIQIGHGPAWCSSETTLDITPRVCWDVNGYYRGLGVDWRASRKELKEAFYRKNGHESIWLTYVLKQLLNPEIRRQYDMAPPGEPFLDDDFVQENIKRQAHEEAYRRTMAQGQDVHRDEVLKEWGLTAVSADETDETERVDSDPGVGQDEPSDSQESWEYSFYLWRTVTGSPALMRRWQGLILRELSACRRTVRFSVGLIGKESSAYVLRLQGNHFFIFLNEDCHPTAELAAQAVRETTSL